MSSSASFTPGLGLQDVEKVNALNFGQAYKSNVNLNLVDPGALAVGGDLGALGIAAANDAVEQIATLSGDLVDEVMSFSGSGSQAVINYAATESDRTRSFSAGAVTLIADEAEKNRSFVGQGLTKALDSVIAAGKAVMGAADNERVFVANAGKYVIDKMAGESDANRAFAGQATQTVIDTLTGEADRNRLFAGQGARMVVDAIAGENAGNRALVSSVASDMVGIGNKILNFSAGEADANRAFAGQAVTKVASTGEAALGAVTSGFGKFMDSLNTTIDQAFSFAGGSVVASNAAQADAIRSISDASKVNLEFLGDQAGRLETHTYNTLQGITSFVKDLMTGSDQRTAALISDVSHTNSENIRVLGDATRSEAAKSIDKIILLTGVAIVVFGGAMLYAKGGK